MLHLEKILFAQDFSSCSYYALPHALELARRTEAELHVLHADVLNRAPFTASAAPAGLNDRLRERLKDLTEARQHLTFDPGSVRVRHALVHDVAAGPAILRYAEEHDVDLIVMGTHGRRGVRHLLLGSVAHEVVRLATCPVLTVRQQEAPRMPLAVRRILVPIDFSVHAREALRLARELGARFEARLDLLHIVEEVVDPSVYNLGLTTIYEAVPDIEVRVEGNLGDFYRRAGGPEVDHRFITQPGHAARDIIRYAEDEDIDLIVMATHGLTGLEHFLLGSVAEKVVSGASCPVFTVKAFGKSIIDLAAATAASAAP